MEKPEYAVLRGSALDILRDLVGPVHTTVTSPPYWKLLDYLHPGQLGQEDTPESYIENLCLVFDEVKRITEPDGTLWVNIGDTYRDKQLTGIPWLLAFAMKKRGWLLRSDIIWCKPSSKPEPCKDRPSRNHEYLFLFAKGKKYFYDYEAILEPHTNPWAIDCIKKAQETGQTARPRSNPFSKEERRAKGTKGITRAEYGALMNPKGKNKRSVWTVMPAWDKRNHFALFPEALIKPCILAGCPKGGWVLDPFCGSGTSGKVSLENGRNFIGIELVDASADLADEALRNVSFPVDKPAEACEAVNNVGTTAIEQYELSLQNENSQASGSEHPPKDGNDGSPEVHHPCG
jgi:DNA modification methylase